MTSEEEIMKAIIRIAFATTLIVATVSANADWTFFSQRDGRWSGNRMGVSTCTVGRYGCAMTSVAMVLSGGGANVDPGRLNAFLGANGGYTNDGSIYWGVGARYDGPAGVLWGTTAVLNSPAQLKGWIDQGYGVVAQSRRFTSGHWAAIRRYEGLGNTWGSFVYWDPYDTAQSDRRVGDAWVKSGVAIRLYKLPTTGGGGGGGSQLFISESSEVGEGQVGFHRYGPANFWSQTSAYGDGGHMFYTKNNSTAHGIDNMADWRPLIPTTRAYEIKVFIPRQFGTTTCARYEIYHAGGRTDVQLNQLVRNDEWVSLGTYTFNQGSGGFLRLIDVTSENHLTKFIAFDAAKWEAR